MLRSNREWKAMSYDLCPKKKEAGDFRFGAFSWPVLLEACGYLFPCVHGQGQYCSVDDKWVMLGTNDGFKVSADDAKLMARCARNFVAIQRGLPSDHIDRFPPKIRTDFVDRFERFAEWAEKSGGFSIH
jgi:hypothetical protein